MGDRGRGQQQQGHRSSARRGGIAAKDHTDPVDDLYPAAMDLGLDGKVALVTGASRSIGMGSPALAAEGARVAISSHSRERIEAAARSSAHWRWCRLRRSRRGRA